MGTVARKEDFHMKTFHMPIIYHFYRTIEESSIQEHSARRGDLYFFLSHSLLFLYIKFANII